MTTRRQAKRGHALLEFAIASAVLIPFMFGTFQFGYAFYTYNRLQTAVSNAGRYAAVRTYRAATANSIDKVILAVKNMVVYGTPAPAEGAKVLAPGLTTGKVNVVYTLASGIPTEVQVNINNYTVEAVFSSYNLSNKPLAVFPYLGRYAPTESEP